MPVYRLAGRFPPRVRPRELWRVAPGASLGRISTGRHETAHESKPLQREPKRRSGPSKVFDLPYCAQLPAVDKLGAYAQCEFFVVLTGADGATR
jgi:hypothetical protein